MKKQSSRMLSLVTAVCLTVSLAVPALAAKDFTDMDADYWGYDAIQTCAEQGIVTGFEDGSFRPEDPVTSMQFAILLTRTFYAEQVAAVADLDGQPWYYAYEKTARDSGLTLDDQGKDTVQLSDESAVSRFDMARMMYNVIRENGKTSDVSDETLEERTGNIADWSDVPEQYADAVKYCYALGLITGTDGGKFSGGESMSRAQACTVMTRMMDLFDQPSNADEAEEPAAPADSEQSAEPENPGETNDPTETENPADAEDPAEAENPAESENPTETPAEPEEPAEPEKLQGPTLANGKEITDDNIREIIYGLKDEYPEGRRWTNDDSHFSPALRMLGYGCAGFALICSDAVFGDMPVTERHSDFDRIRVCDVLRVNNDTHSVVVLEKKADSVVVTEGNYNDSIHWDREISRASLEQGHFYVTTRYPDGI